MEGQLLQDRFASPDVLPVGDFLSPALTPRQADAFELKFLVDRTTAAQIESWARERMVVDPHGHAHRNGAYTTTTLYCDTPHLDVFLKSPSYRRKKFRLRRYGDCDEAFLERKTKSGQRVRKRRTSIPLAELPFLEGAVSTDDWEGHWFHRRILLKGLGPCCALRYDRTAFGKPNEDGRMRLTLDRHISSQRTDAWEFPKASKGLPVLRSQAILELKYQTALPALFKEFLEVFGLQPSAHSKYRSALQAWGVSADRSELAYA
jgi:hypothetical protein